MTQGIQEQVRILSTIEAEAHFVQIGREMLRGDAMPCADNSALQKRKRIFYGVGVNIPINIDLSFMLDRLMLLSHCEGFHGGRIGIEFVGHNYIDIGAYILADELRQCAGFSILRVEEPEITAALPNADDDLLVGISVSGFAVGMLFPADVSFINFDSAVQDGALNFFHRGSDAVTEIPRRFVADSERALDLICAHALACFAEKQGSEKPFLQGQMRIVKDCAGSDRELVITSFAIEQLLGCGKFYDCAVTAEAFNSVRPAETNKKFAAFVVGIEQVYNVN